MDNGHWVLLLIIIVGCVVYAYYDKKEKICRAERERALELQKLSDLAAALAVVKGVDITIARKAVERASKETRNKWEAQGIVAAEIIRIEALDGRGNLNALIKALSKDLCLDECVVRCAVEKSTPKRLKNLAQRPLVAVEIERSYSERIATLRARGNDGSDIDLG